MRRRSNSTPITFMGVSCIVAGLALGVFLTDDRNGSLYAVQPDFAFEKMLREAKRSGRSGDWDVAHKLLKKHANLENPSAKLEYALLFAKGWGAERDLEKARLLLLQAVQFDFEGRGHAAFELGRIYRLSKGKDCPRIAFEWFNRAVQWGFTKAHGEIGKSYARGLGIKVDYEKSLKHYSLAVENGSASAVVSLFEVAFEQQRDGNADPGRGRLLANKYIPVLEAAAKDGNRVASRTLGRIFDRGLFVERDIDRAMKWLAMAASQGDAVAMHDVALLGLARKQQPLEIAKAISFLEQSTELGYPAAMTALGRLYISDDSIRDISKAISFLEMGAKAGHPGSMAELAKLHLEGSRVPQNIKLARQFAEQGALQNHRGCKRMLLQIDAFQKKQAMEG